MAEREEQKRVWLEAMAKQNEDAKLKNVLKQKLVGTAAHIIEEGPSVLLQNSEKAKGLATLVASHVISSKKKLPGTVSVEANSSVSANDDGTLFVNS